MDFLGCAKDGDYQKDILRAACSLPSDHIDRVRSAIADAETRCAEAASSIASYSAAAPKPQPQDTTTAYSTAVPPPPSANTQALIDAAAARDFELARRVAQADATRQQEVRVSELRALVDGFIAADRQFLQLPGGMQAWERGFVHEYTPYP